jgi:hypothetical protein
MERPLNLQRGNKKSTTKNTKVTEKVCPQFWGNWFTAEDAEIAEQR